MGAPAGPAPDRSERVRRQPDVRVLGPVEVSVPGTGAAPEDACTELVVLLALNAAGLPPDDVLAALWPRWDRGRALAALAALAGRTRDWLGEAELTLVVDPDRLRIDPAPVVDSDLFRQAVRDGGTADALGLLRGPFPSGAPGGRWSWLAETGLGRGLPALVIDACARLARARLQEGDPDGAREAAEAGLRVVPLDERLWRERLRAAAAAGDHDGVVELGRQLAALRRRELPPDDTVQPETRALLAELRRSRPPGPTG